MATITKVSAKSWRVRWDEYSPTTGQRIQRSKTFSRAADATAFKASIEAGDIVPGSVSEQRFSQYVADWWEVYQSNLEATTIKGYNLIIKRLSEYFGAAPISSITPTKINKLYAQLQRPDNGIATSALSPASVKRYHAVLRLIFAAALIDSAIKSNPMQLVKPPREIKKEIELPSIEDVKQQLASLRGTPNFVAASIAFYAGLRRAEILGLKWCDIDLRAHTINVRRVRQRYKPNTAISLNAATHTIELPGRGTWVERDYPKSKHARKFILPPELLAILRDEKKVQAANRLRIGASYIDSDYVCVHDNGLPISGDTLSRCMAGLCRLHDLRHLNVSYMLDAGVPIAEVARRAGHTTPQTTLTIYTHAIKEQDEEAATALDEALGHI